MHHNHLINFFCNNSIQWLMSTAKIYSKSSNFMMITYPYNYLRNMDISMLMIGYRQETITT